MTTFQVIGEQLNKQVIMAKFIRSLYFIEKPVDDQPKEKQLLFKNKFNFMDQLRCIKFKFTDKFSHILRMFHETKNKMKKVDASMHTFLDDSEYIYQRGYDLVENEINLFNIIQTIQKLKAGMATLVGKD